MTQLSQILKKCTRIVHYNAQIDNELSTFYTGSGNKSVTLHTEGWTSSNESKRPLTPEERCTSLLLSVMVIILM